MPNLNLGYQSGNRQILYFKVKASAAIVAGDLVILDSGGFVTPAVAGSNDPIGVSFDTITGGAADGDVLCGVDISTSVLYTYAVGAGTLTQAMLGTTCDIYTAQSIDVTASADDCLEIVNVDTVNQLATVRIVRTPAGVV